MLNVKTNIGRLAPPRCDVVKNSQAAKVQTGFERISSLSEPPKAVWKRWNPRKDARLGLDFGGLGI
jgi:hypothetical protein